MNKDTAPKSGESRAESPGAGLSARGVGPPEALRGFEHINRYWDPVHNVYGAKILPGEFYVTRHDEMIVTVLGSCVSACVRDPVSGIGGMNHFMLPGNGRNAPEGWGGKSGEPSARYGVYAMERLINEILKNGGFRKHLEVKIVGGGRILAHMTDIGQRNIEFVQEFIRTEGFKLLAADLGDIYPRKVYYFQGSGKMRVKKLRTLHNATIVERENNYQQDLARKPVEGDITLF